MGVKGITLRNGDEVVAMQLETQGEYITFVSANGYGKRNRFTDFKLQNRGGKGVKCYKITEKTGNIIGIKAVNQDSEIMLITTEGIIIRMKVEDISLLGRVTSGVKLINMDDDITVASIAKVREDKSLTTQEETEDTEEAESENEK